MKRQTGAMVARCAIAICYLLLAVAMFLTGRTHTLLVDNKGSQEGLYEAVDGMEVRVDGGAPEEMLRNDRSRFTVKGQRVTLSIEFFDGREGQEFTVRIPLLQDTVLLSVPRLLAGVEPALEPFEAQ